MNKSEQVALIDRLVFEVSAARYAISILEKECRANDKLLSSALTQQRVDDAARDAIREEKRFSTRLLGKKARKK